MSDILQWMMKRGGKQIRGVLHIGANSGQEAAHYSMLGLKVIWIEADPHVCSALRANIALFPNQFAYQCLASDVDGQVVDFHVASNEGGSSSILKPDSKEFSKEWPTIKEVSSVRLTTCRLETLLKQQGCAFEDVNLIVADVQGYELPVLRGLGSLLASFEAVISELNWTPMYEGATKPYELEAFLASHGFVRLWLGLSHPQATGIWVRGRAGAARRLYMTLSSRLYFGAARSGLVKLMRGFGLLDWGRVLYCAAKKRNV